MNEQLEPVFKVVLFGLEEAKIDYWVYGGVSIAAFARKFIRENNDIDIFVKDTDFQRTKLFLEELCNKHNNFRFRYSVLDKNQRPKIEIKIDNKERLSVVPVYLKDNSVEFRFWKGLEEYPKQILEKVERKISCYRFFTPPDKYIKELFINYLNSRRDKKFKDKLIIDAKAILSPEEFTKIYAT